MPVGLWGDADGSLYRSSYFELFPGVWRQGDWIRFSERGSCDRHGPLRRHAQPRRRPPRHGRVLQRHRGAAGDHGQPRRPPRGRRGRPGRAAALRRARRRRRAGRRAARPASPKPALAALAAPRARHDPRRARDSPHADRQEARDARQAHPPRRAGGRRRQQGLAPRPDRARHLRRDRDRTSSPPVAESERLSLEDVVAIDVHAHVEMSAAGGDSLPDELRDAAVAALPRRVGETHGGGARAVLPRAEDDGRRLHGRLGVLHRAGARAERGDRRGGEGERRRPDPVREHRPAQGAARRRRGAAPDRRARRARLQVPPERAGLLPERPAWPTRSTR